MVHFSATPGTVVPSSSRIWYDISRAAFSKDVGRLVDSLSASNILWDLSPTISSMIVVMEAWVTLKLRCILFGTVTSLGIRS